MMKNSYKENQLLEVINIPIEVIEKHKSNNNCTR